MSFHFLHNNEFNDFDLEKENEYLIQESIIFLVDGAQQMFTDNFFEQCLDAYQTIVRQKCSQNKKDKLGFFIYGTIETNCDIDNVMILQKFDTVTIDTLKNVKSIIKNYDKYKQLSATKYSLYDIFSYVFQQLHTFKTSIKTRYIIVLCTCDDKPCNEFERRRIEHLVSTFKDTQTELRVIGFSNSWNDEMYYKDLQIISGTFTSDDYKRFYLNDFKGHILNPSKSITTLSWKISSDICMDVSIYNLISAPKYPSKIKLEKEENVVLEARHVLYKQNTEDSQSQSLSEQRIERTQKKVITSDNIMYYKMYNGVKICFSSSECKKIKNLGLEPGIEILAFKPVMCDPLYHVTSPYFVTYTKYSNHERKIFFKSFVSRCVSKKVMAICKVVTKYTVLICQMIPSEDDGGFYMYKIPFEDSVRNLNNQLHKYVYNSENKCPINNEAVEVFKKLMDQSKVNFDPKSFTNQKLEKCIAHIEALALDEKLGALPPDSTLPPPLSVDAEILKDTLINILNLNNISVSSMKRNKLQVHGDEKRLKLSVEDVANNKKLHTLTVVQLKEFLRSISQVTSGSKSILIERIYNYLQLEAP